MFNDATYKGIEEQLAAGAQRKGLDVNGIPTPEDIARGRTLVIEAGAERLIRAVRTYLTGDMKGTFDPVGRGEPIATPERSVARANEALAAVGWRIEIGSSQKDGTTYILAPVKR